MDSCSFFRSCQKYLQTLFKDGKRISPDFELLNQLYVNIADNELPVPTSESQFTANNKILIDLNFPIEDKYISESFLWDLETSSTAKINTFIENFIGQTIYEQELKIDRQNLQVLKQQCKIQLQTQILYKSLLKKHAGILLNFSTMEISQDIREYLIQIQLRLTNQEGEIFFEDAFEWDVLNEQNNVETFCQTLMQDEQIPSKYFSELCYKIRTQINEELQLKFTLLVKTFRSIHRDRESPKLNTQTMTQLKKNLIYTMDVGLTQNPDTDKPISNIVLNNSDLFSLLSRNMDILPEEFHENLICKEGKSLEKENKEKISKKSAEEFLEKKGCRVDDNGYLGNFTTNYRLHRIWRKEVDSD